MREFVTVWQRQETRLAIPTTEVRQMHAALEYVVSTSAKLEVLEWALNFGYRYVANAPLFLQQTRALYRYYKVIAFQEKYDQ